MEALNVAVQAVEAMVHLHAHDIVHRDVKPDNLVLTKEGVVKLMDLGLARSTQDRQRIELENGNAIGTPLYISPEQIHGRSNVDGRSDLYSLGASLYHMMTGSPPFLSDDSVAILQAHLKNRPMPPKSIRSRITDESNRMILRLLAKDPAKRFANTGIKCSLPPPAATGSALPTKSNPTSFSWTWSCPALTASKPLGS